MDRNEDFHVIGLTGPTGAGKSTVSEVFSNEGFFVINCDEVSHEVTDSSAECLAELVHEFSASVLNDDGTLNRRRLADIVFADKSKKACLEGVIYPYITEKILKILKSAAENGIKYVLLDAPTLFESNADDFCDMVVCVTASEEMRFQNITRRDGITPKQARARIEAQPPEEFYIKRSDFTIYNKSCIDTLRKMAKEIAVRIKEYYAVD